MRQLVEQNGGEVVGEMYVSLNARREEFYPILRDIRGVRPDVIFSTVVGTPTVYLYQTYADFGFNPATTPIASLTTTEAEISAMGYDVGEGHITAAPYFEGIGGSSGTDFVSRYKKMYGDSERTNMCVEAAYFQVKLFAKALEQVNTLDPDVLRPVVLGTTVDAPQGPVTINPSCGHANVWSRVGRCRGNGTFSIVYQSSSEVTADPFLIGRPRMA